MAEIVNFHFYYFFDYFYIDFGCLVEAFEMSFYHLDRKQIYQKNLEIYCSIKK